MRLFIVTSLILFLPFFQVNVPTTQAKETSSQRADHVILIDWDGFDLSYYEKAKTPNLDNLKEKGSFSVAEGTYQTMSNSVRASMSTGATPSVHGNISYFYDTVEGKAFGQTRHLEAETIAEALAEEGKTVASVQWYMIQNHGVVFGDPAHLYVQPGGTFDVHADIAIDILNQRPVNSGGEMVSVPKIPDFLAIYGSHLDAFGHDKGAEHPSLIEELEELDRQLGRIIQATKDVGIYDSTTFIVTSDHGMTSQDISINDHVISAIQEAGFIPEIVSPGNSPQDETNVIITTAVRIANLTLRGEAETDEAKQQIEEALRKVDKVTNVFNESDLKNLKVHPKVGQIVIEAEAPWGFSLSDRPVESPRGGHGSLKEMNVPFFIGGAGIRDDVMPENPRLIDLAPTIAELLGNRMPVNAEGRVLSEILTDFNIEEKVDLTDLERLIAGTKGITNEETYTDLSFEALQEAIREAEAALHTIETPEELADAINNLSEAVESLEPLPVVSPIDLSGLEELIAEAKTITNEETYTDLSFEVLQEAIREAEAALHTIETPEELAKTINRLSEAVESLEPLPEIPSIDLSDLEELIAEANAISNEGKYTEKTYQELQNAISRAIKSLTKINTQQDLQNELHLLKKAIQNLESVPLTEDSVGDKLPATATAMFNYLIMGSLLIFVGLLVYFIKRKRTLS